MNVNEFERLIRDFFEVNCIGLMVKKRKEYVRGNDIFHNFKKSGASREKSPEEALQGMKQKQTTSIDDLVQELDRNDKKYNKRVEISEEEYAIWREKLRDDVNYDFLLFGLVTERLIRRL